MTILRGTLHALATACLVCLYVFISAAIASADTAPPDISLEGTAAFTSQLDGVELADPAYDDSAWRRIDVPGSLRAAGVPPAPDVAWYRITFSLPDGWSSARPAIRFGVLTRADETYLNGVRIGGEGLVGPRRSVWHNYPPVLPRLYPFGPGLLHSDRPNVLAVRIARKPYVDEGGIISGPVALVDYLKALPDYTAQRQRFASVDFFFFGVESVIALILVFALAVGVRDRAVMLFLAAFGFYYLGSLERRHFFHEAGLNSQPVEFLAAILLALSPVALLSFVAHVFDHPVGRLGRTTQIIMVVGMISFPANGIEWLEVWRVHSNAVMHSGMSVALLLILFWCLSAVWRREPHGIPLLVGLGMLTLTVLSDIAVTTNVTEAYFGFRQIDLGTLSLLLSLAFVVGQRLFETEKALHQANSSVLMAHENERGRLARDIHDGVGQWLTAIKLKLELIESDAKEDHAVSARLTSLVDDVSHAIEDTRRIAHDLSPALLEKHGLAVAMKSHAERLETQKPIVVRIDAPSSLELPDRVRDHLYRTFQEALKNAVEHSDGTRIDVTLRQSDRHIVLDVSDDGVGLNGTPAREAEGVHMGLKSIAERVRLLGGRMEIAPGNDRGSTLRVTVPLEKTDV